jgi:hypothetical protein|tara:strand:+ start:590 stop:805 length:216 start_codon:yes stop_codon:yes gene_type:complete
MDINLCVDQLGLNANYYTLNQSNVPHEIVRWDGPATQPTQAELETAWAEIQADEDYQAHLADPTKSYPVAA